jgi:Holliday junction DNA helicase RuvA
LIATLNGTITSKKPEGIIVDVGGVGYSVAVPLRSLGDIPEEGSGVLVYTYTHVREDALQLFGFLSEYERGVFATLLGISGIGPKLALAILSGMPVERFIESVHNEDIPLLSTIPGLGKKTASRIVLELKGKLPSLRKEGADSSGKGLVAGDAVSALVNLGYKRALSEDAVARAVKAGCSSIEDIIKEALRLLTEG